MVDGLVVKKVLGDDLLDNLLLDLLAELFRGDILAVLGRHDNGVDTEGYNGTVVVSILDGDLRLGIRSQPGKRAILAGCGHGRVELVGEEEGKREQLGGLVGGIAEHDALVTGTKLLESLVVVQALGNIRRLLLNGNEDVAGLVVEALVRRVVADLLDGITDNLLEVDVSLGGDLAEDHDHARLGRRLAGDLGEWVVLEAGIEDSVRDLITVERGQLWLGNEATQRYVPDLIGMALADGLGGEKEGVLETVSTGEGETGHGGRTRLADEAPLEPLATWVPLGTAMVEDVEVEGW